MKFRKKPVVIEAYRFAYKAGVDDRPEWLLEAVRMGVVEFIPHGQKPPSLAIHTLEGTMTAAIGDWIIKGVRGELYPCNPDIFDATYEAV